jgi:ferritin
MLSAKMQQALNDQINAELYSSYLYLSMAAHSEAANLQGFAHWLRIQSQEEYGHAMRIFDFVLDRCGRVELKPIQGPPTSWESPLAMFEAVLAHEQHVTRLIHQLAAQARAENDYPTEVFLQWFVNEQVEEEKQSDQIVQKLRQVGNVPGGIYWIDQELAHRKED